MLGKIKAKLTLIRDRFLSVSSRELTSPTNNTCKLVNPQPVKGQSPLLHTTNFSNHCKIFNQHHQSTKASQDVDMPTPLNTRFSSMPDI